MEEGIKSIPPRISQVGLKLVLIVSTIILWAVSMVLLERVGISGAIPFIIISMPFLYAIIRLTKSEGGKHALAILLSIVAALLLWASLKS